MTTREIATRLVALCREHQNMEAVRALYSDDIVSVEAVEGQGMPREMRGKEAVLGKGQWWFDNHVIHSSEVSGAMYHGDDRFACVMKYDVTFKVTGQRFKMEEIALYTVANGRIVREEFFYDMQAMK